MSLITAMPSAQRLLLSFPSVTEAAAAAEDCRTLVHVVIQALGLNDQACWKPISGNRDLWRSISEETTRDPWQKYRAHHDLQHL